MTKLPTISIVTPSYNQGQFLEDAIHSVLGQNYPNLEYVVIDGGSHDASVDVLRKHEDKLSYWISEPDAGQYDAINKGFERTTGSIMAWLNSDDKYLPWTFQIVGEIFSCFPEIEWITTLYPLHWDERGRAVKCSYQGGYSRQGFWRGENLPSGKWFAKDWIQQESTFWRRSLWERAGGQLDTKCEIAADFELWARFYNHAELYGIGTPLGGFRKHGDQKTGHHYARYIDEAEQIFRSYGGSPPGQWASRIRARLLCLVPTNLAISLHLTSSHKTCLYMSPQGEWEIIS